MAVDEIFTADDLVRLGPDARFELVDGALIEYPFHGVRHGLTVARIADAIGSFNRANDLGTVYLGQVGQILKRDPDTVLAPDLSFIRTDRDTDTGDGFLTVAPDLVVEVVESYETPDWIERKIRIFLEAGVGQVWIVEPALGELRIRLVAQAVSIYGPNDIVSGDDLFPGFEMWVSDLFSVGFVVDHYRAALK